MEKRVNRVWWTASHRASSASVLAIAVTLPAALIGSSASADERRGGPSGESTSGAVQITRGAAT